MRNIFSSSPFSVTNMPAKDPTTSRIAFSPYVWIWISFGISIALHALGLIGESFFHGHVWAHEPMHSFVETSGATIGLAVAGLLLLMHRMDRGSGFKVPLAFGLIGMSFLDGMHALVHVGQAFVWLHSSATFAGGVLFAMVLLPKRFGRDSIRVAGAICTVLLLGGMATFVTPDMMPAMIHDGKFTTMAVFLNIGGGVLMIAAALRLAIAYTQGRNRDDLLFAVHCMLFGGAAIMFEQSQLWDFSWWWWHGLRLAAYAVVLAFAFGSLIQFQREIRLHRDELISAKESAIHEANNVYRELASLRQAMEKHTLFSIADRAGKITDVNEGFCRISGYSRDELIGQDHRMLNSGHHPKQFWKDMWRIIQLGKPWRGEVCNRAKDGSLYWVDSTNVPQFDEHGKLIRYVSLRFDITEKKEAEQKNAQLVAALNSSNDCLLMFDAKTLDFVYTNHGAKEQIGYTDAELASMTPVDIKPDFDVQSFADAIAPLYEKPGNSVMFRTRHQHKDGHCIPVEISLQLMEELGDHGLFIAAVRDISAQLESERQIADAKARLERATNGTSDGLWDYIPATGEVWYADQFKKLVGFERQEYDKFEPTLDSFVDLLHPDDKDRTLAAINAHLKEDVPYDVEYRLRMRCGGYRWFRARGRATRDEHGIATRLSGSICDVQATHDAFDLVEQANKAKSEFLANMSHEIRTPMAAILGYSDLLGGDLADDPTQAADAVRTIQSNANHLLTIINDILDVSKIEAGQMAVEAIETSPTQIISEVLSLVRPRANGKGVNVGVIYQTPIPVHIQSDPTRLRQILLNLVGNAIKFTEVGSVTIHASCDTKSQQLKLSVVDTGIGMSPEQCEVISKFDAFSQADASTTRKFGGSGLGLRISNALAQMLGGGIEVSSVQGQGSTFTATVATGDLGAVDMLNPEEAVSGTRQKPDKTQDEATVQPAAAKPLDGIRILLAEDGPDNQRLISFHLKKAGADVTICENGRIAVEALENMSNDQLANVVLMDMQMPELDGYAAARRLRDQGFTIPIIALTAHAMEGDRQKCVDAGCDDYLSKPIDKQQLIESCASWASSHIALTAE